MPKITKRMVDSLVPKPEGDVVVWDAELKGFWHPCKTIWRWLLLFTIPNQAWAQPTADFRACRRHHPGASAE